MFTVKIVRVAGEVHHTRIIEASHVDVECVGNMKRVVVQETDGDTVSINMAKDSPPQEDSANIVFIENSSGKTTDVVRS